MADYSQQQVEDDASQQSPYSLNSQTGAASQAQAPQQTSTQQIGQQGSGRYQNIQKLMDANQGLGAQQAQRAVSTAQTAYNGANSALTSATQQYQQQAKAATPTYTYNGQAPVATYARAGTATNAPVQQAAPAQGGLAGAAQRQTAGLNSGALTTSAYTPNNTAAATNAATAAYTGPHALTDVSGFQNVSDQVTQAQSIADALKNQQSLQALLGGNGFDALLAQKEGGADLSAAAGRFGGIQNALNSAVGNTSAGDAAKATTAAANAAGANYLKNQATANTIATDQKNQQAALASAQANLDATAKPLYQKYLGVGHISGGMSYDQFRRLTPADQAWWSNHGGGFRGFATDADNPKDHMHIGGVTHG